MVGRELKDTYPTRAPAITDEVLLDVQHLHGNGLSDISFKVARGEVLGLAGLIGAGRTELAELIFGVKPRTAGRITLEGKAISPRSPREAIDLGIGLVPEDRKRQGALLSTDIKSNISMAILKKISVASVVKKREEGENRSTVIRRARDSSPQPWADRQDSERRQSTEGRPRQVAGRPDQEADHPG